MNCNSGYFKTIITALLELKDAKLDEDGLFNTQNAASAMASLYAGAGPTSFKGTAVGPAADPRTEFDIFPADSDPTNITPSSIQHAIDTAGFIHFLNNTQEIYRDIYQFYN